MENLKKGDIVKLETDINMHFPKGINMTVFYVNKDYIELCTSLKAKTCNVKKIGESQMQYEESNRYKLAEAIKKTGLKVGELSIVAKDNANYFGNYHNKSRFNERGDISEARLNELLTDLAFAERELLGIGAKTVEEQSDAEIQMIDSANAVDISVNHDDQADAASYAIKKLIENQERNKIKSKSNKPLFIGVAVVISIVLILFILNNYFQVV